MSARMMILGLDGASWRLSQELVSQGRMPTLGRMMKEGAAGPLYSTVPAISPTAWASFMTGRNPGQHGVYGFGLKVPGSYFLEPFSSRGRVQAQSLWGVLSSRGKRVAVVNVPMTYPPEPVNGLMISGFGTPDESSNKFVYPPEYMDALRAKLGPYILDLNWVDYESRGVPALLEDARKMTRCRADYGLHVLGQEDWDLFTLVFVITDRLQHCLWQYLEPVGKLTPEQQAIRNQVLDFYDYLDSILDEFIKASPESTVMLMSDHGFGHFSATVNLNNWLSEQGLLAWQSQNRAQMRWAVKLGRKLGINRNMFRRVADLLGLDTYRHLERVTQRVNNIDWGKTKAFSYSADGIYFNLKGREREGGVEPGAEADRLFEELKEKLLDLRDPATGKNIVYRVVRPSEIYKGAKVDTAPDLIICESDARYTFNFNLARASQVFTTAKWRSGNHEPEGIVVVHGPRIAKRRLQRADLIDLAPSALYLLGESVPMEMDGRVLTELVADEEKAAPVMAAAATQTVDSEEMLSSEEKEMVFERLKGLGYFE